MKNEKILNDIKLLDLLIDTKTWALKNEHIKLRKDINNEKYYMLTEKGKRLDWVHKAKQLYYYLIKMPHFALQEHLLKKVDHVDDVGEKRTFRVTGKAILLYGDLIVKDFVSINNLAYSGTRNDDIMASFALKSLFHYE